MCQVMWQVLHGLRAVPVVSLNISMCKAHEQSVMDDDSVLRNDQSACLWGILCTLSAANKEGAC